MTSQPSKHLDRACEVLHDAYERAAVSTGWQTQVAARTSWDDLPEANKATMRIAVAELLVHLHKQRPI